MASQVQIPFEGVILQEHSAPISCPTPNFAKGSTDNPGRFPPEGHPPSTPRRHFSPYIPHSRNSNRRICVAPAGFGEAAPVHLTSGPSSLFPFGDFVDLLMYFKEVSCSHQRKFLARRSFGHWEPHRFTGSSRPSCNPGFTEVLSWVQVEGWRERRPAFVKDILGNYIHDLDVFEFSLTPFRPCQLQKIYCISVRFRCTVAEYGEQKCLFEQCSCCFPACLNVGVVRVSFFPYGIEKGHILEARGANRTVPIFLAPTLMPGTHTYSNVTVEEKYFGQRRNGAVALVRVEQEWIPVKREHCIFFSKGEKKAVVYRRFVRELKGGKVVSYLLSLLQNSLGSRIYCREELLSLGARASRPHKTWQGRGDWLHRVGRFTRRLTLEQRLDKYAGGTPALPGGNPWLARCRSLSRALFCRSILPPSHARLRILQKALLFNFLLYVCVLWV